MSSGTEEQKESLPLSALLTHPLGRRCRSQAQIMTSIPLLKVSATVQRQPPERQVAHAKPKPANPSQLR